MMKWMLIVNFEERAYIMRRVKGKTEYLAPNGKIKDRPYFYDYLFEAQKVFNKFAIIMLYN
mgnify:CR=1 FL=1